MDAALVSRGEAPVLCRIEDSNLYGARVRLDAPPLADSFYVIDLDCRVAHRARVIWREGGLVGMRFIASWNLASDTAPDWIKASALTAERLRIQDRAELACFGSAEPERSNPPPGSPDISARWRD